MEDDVGVNFYESSWKYLYDMFQDERHQNFGNSLEQSQLKRFVDRITWSYFSDFPNECNKL